MAQFTKEDMLRTADLARLTISDEEAANYSTQLSEILTFAEKINEINTTDVKPTTNGNSLTSILRKDEPKKWDKRDEALNNAPDHEDGQFKVPSIMD
ncbi:MAG TPA: Asp-tRNA(Asn)/Glu-tRNA(Gln) amidotransferase subunit GatC [Pseudogracilibacillus sp.]|nr:Asp-tRNA(Asn)/Glu-tRNA(Gln) amidotransferase subunit GatC [Pseudogracilibacillus sp.]